MSKRILVAGSLLALVGYACISERHLIDAEEDAPSGVSAANPLANEDSLVDAEHADVTLASWIALLAQEEIGWNEFGAARAIDPDTQRFARNMIEERQNLLKKLKPFAPDATHVGYLNKTAKDARAMGITVVRKPHAIIGRDGKRQAPEDHRLDQPSPVDRTSAEAARVASYKGRVAAAVRNNYALQSPANPPTSDISDNNPAQIIAGESVGGDPPPVAGIVAPGANSVGALPVGGVVQGSVAGVNGAQMAGNASVNPGGAVGAGIQGRQTGNASTNPSGLLSGPATGTNSATGANAGTGPSGLPSGPAAGTPGPQSGNTSSKNPTGLLSGPAAGANLNPAQGTGSNNPSGLLSGPAAGVQGPQSGSTGSTNSTGLLSGPAAGSQGPQSGNTSSKNPTGLLSGPAASSNATPAQSAGSNNPSGLLSGPAAGVQGPQSGNTSSKNPTGLLSGPAAGNKNSSDSPTQTAPTNAAPNNGVSKQAAASTSSANPIGQKAQNQTAQSNPSQVQNGISRVDALGNPVAVVPLVDAGGIATTGDVGVVEDYSNPPTGVGSGGVSTTGRINPSSGSSGAQRTSQPVTNDDSVLLTSERRTMAMDARGSGNRTFDVATVERQLAVQSLAGSKRLLEQKTGHEIDRAFIRQEMAMQKDLLDKLAIFQKHASPELKDVLANAERELIHNMKMTRQLIEKRSDQPRVVDDNVK
ncbi:MAG: hypothetical protein JWN70_1424 [Planctomycetaceae bacterium]|nr:hypothetical protein [Planctomycetaceae bacterium]